MVICKKCFESKFLNWKKPFLENVEEPAIIPAFNEEAQHYQVYSVEELAQRLENNEMLEVICGICKITHIGKDINGIIKTRKVGETWKNHTN